MAMALTPLDLKIFEHITMELMKELNFNFYTTSKRTIHEFVQTNVERIVISYLERSNKIFGHIDDNLQPFIDFILKGLTN